MLPNFDRSGNLPPGIHFAGWDEFVSRFSGTTQRRRLLTGLRQALVCLASAGCGLVYIDGSFVTRKAIPGDFDACWSIEEVDGDMLDPIFLDFSDGRATQKVHFGGELFPAELPEGESGKVFLDFFQTDRETGKKKGIVAIALDLTELIATNPDDNAQGDS